MEIHLQNLFELYENLILLCFNKHVIQILIINAQLLLDIHVNMYTCLLVFTGIKGRLSYIKDDLQCKIIYINSMYKSNDNDRIAVVDHRTLMSVFGTMEDFESLQKFSKKMKGMLEHLLFIFLFQRIVHSWL